MATVLHVDGQRQVAGCVTRDRRPVIVQVLLNLGKGGMEAVAINLARWLDPARYRPVIVALDPKIEPFAYTFPLTVDPPEIFKPPFPT